MEVNPNTDEVNAITITNSLNRDSICFHGSRCKLALHVMKLYLRDPELVVCDRRLEMDRTNYPANCFNDIQDASNSLLSRLHGTDYNMAKRQSQVNATEFYKTFSSEVMPNRQAAYAFTDGWSIIDMLNGKLHPIKVSIVYNRVRIELDPMNISEQMAVAVEGTINYLVETARRCQTYEDFKDNQLKPLHPTVSLKMANDYGPHFKPEDIKPTRSLFDQLRVTDIDKPTLATTLIGGHIKANAEAITCLTTGTFSAFHQPQDLINTFR